MMRNTKQVQDRRKISYESFDDVRQDIASLVEAEQAGTLKPLGNWTLGQAFGHLASWINYAFDGYPIKPIPWFLRWIRPLIKRKMVNAKMPAGIRIPNAPQGTHGVEPLTTPDGLDQLKRAIDRLESQAPTLSSPILGKLTHDEWKRLNLNHAELHLSFFKLS